MLLRENPGTSVQSAPSEAMLMELEPQVIARLRDRAARDQYHALLRDYLATAEECKRRQFVALLLGHAPTIVEWQRIEALRAEWKHALQADVTTDGVARMTGLAPATIRWLVERGEMPAPRSRGRWWWWDRGAIEEWLAQRRLP
jgi:excisionase family DNA binding protein